LVGVLREVATLIAALEEGDEVSNAKAVDECYLVGRVLWLAYKVVAYRVNGIAS
jgi:hypothetical protein